MAGVIFFIVGRLKAPSLGGGFIGIRSFVANSYLAVQEGNQLGFG